MLQREQTGSVIVVLCICIMLRAHSFIWVSIGKDIILKIILLRIYIYSVCVLNLLGSDCSDRLEKYRVTETKTIKAHFVMNDPICKLVRITEWVAFRLQSGYFLQNWPV